MIVEQVCVSVCVCVCRIAGRGVQGGLKPGWDHLREKEEGAVATCIEFGFAVHYKALPMRSFADLSLHCYVRLLYRFWRYFGSHLRE